MEKSLNLLLLIDRTLDDHLVPNWSLACQLTRLKGWSICKEKQKGEGESVNVAERGNDIIWVWGFPLHW